MQMQGLLLPIRPRFAQQWLRAFSSSSSDYANQSRGGLPRFFSEVLPPSKGGVVRVQDDEFWHISKVLRLTTNHRYFLGQSFVFACVCYSMLPMHNVFLNLSAELFNGKGGLVEGCIHRIDRTGLDFVALEDPKLVPPQKTKWHVCAAFGTLKGGRADWLVEKCTELGAHSVTPLLTERSPSISENRVERLKRVILAATKQCQRLHEMILNPPTKVDSLLPLGKNVQIHMSSLKNQNFQLHEQFEQLALKEDKEKMKKTMENANSTNFLVQVAQSKLSLLAAAEATPIFNVLASSRKESGLIIVGPEGDFTEREATMMMKAGATAVGLGPLRLRVETATMALLGTLMLWSDAQEFSNA